MLKFYFYGVAVAFFMLMYVFMLSKPWKEEIENETEEEKRRNTIGTVIFSILGSSIFSTFSWIGVIYLFINQFFSIKDE